MKIPYEPSKEDYVKILKIPKRIVEKWFEKLEVSNAEILEKDVRDLWKVDYKISWVRPQVYYFDEWGLEEEMIIKDIIHSILYEMFKSLKSDAEKRKFIRLFRKIVLFGVSRKRGEDTFYSIVDVDIDGSIWCDDVEYYQNKYRSKVVIGIPRKYRMKDEYSGVDYNVLENNLKKILRAIYDSVQED